MTSIISWVISSTDIQGPHASTTCPFSSTKYFQKFHVGCLIFSEYRNNVVHVLVHVIDTHHAWCVAIKYLIRKVSKLAHTPCSPLPDNTICLPKKFILITWIISLLISKFHWLGKRGNHYKREGPKKWCIYWLLTITC